MRRIPFAFQWIIPENQLLASKDSVNEYLKSPSVDLANGAKYSIWITLNGDTDERRGETRIYLYVEIGNNRKYKADYTVSVDTANITKSPNYLFEKTIGWGDKYCKTEEFFDPAKKFIVNEKFIIKVYGIFEFEDPDFHGVSEHQIWEGGKLGNELLEKNDGKDFTMVADDIEIKVHKLVLQNRSPVFATIFESNKESKLEIIEFSFNVVETGIKLLYDCNFKTSLSMDDKMALLQFFDKYNVPSLKDKIEPLLIDQISAATVCRLTNCSIFTNSKKLEEKCMEFLMESFAAKTPLSDIGILDKDIALKILQNSLFHTVTQPE